MLVIVLSGLAYTSVRPFGRSAGPQMALREQEQAIEQQRDSLKLTLERDEIKRRLLRICAACNRGFGASDNDRTAVNTLLRELEPMSPCDAPTAGVADSNNAPWLGRGLENSNWNDGTVANGPLEGVWRLIYTDARDVLSLDANPFAGVGPISQEITLPASVVNVIELVPRVSSLLPPGALRTATTIRVGTRAKARSATRVGLTFETVGAEQQALLGVDVRKLLPPLSLPLPRPPWSDRAGADDEARSRSRRRA